MSREPAKHALHKPSGQARVRLNGKDIYLGEYDSSESYEEHNGILSRHILGKLDVDRASLSISRLSIMYVEFARGYDLKDGIPMSEIHAIQLALFASITLKTLGQKISQNGHTTAMSEPLLKIANHHAASCGDPPIVDGILDADSMQTH